MTTSDDLKGWPPEQTIFAVPQLKLKVLAGDHPVHSKNLANIRENWERETSANPAFFDGRMLLQQSLAVGPDGIFGEGHIIPFSTFLWWRKQPGREGAFHLFGYPVIATSDNALVAIRMGPHTANPGVVYFAAGSLDESDIVDGYCDLAGNMQREVAEETGLDLRDAVADSNYYALHLHRAVTVFRLFRFPLTADEIAARIERHMPDDEEQEIAGPVIIRSPEPAAENYHSSMPVILEWFFNRRR